MEEIVEQFIVTNVQFAFLSMNLSCFLSLSLYFLFSQFRSFSSISTSQISIYYNLISHAKTKTNKHFSVQTEIIAVTRFIPNISTLLNYSILKCRAWFGTKKKRRVIFLLCFGFCVCHGHFKEFYWHGATNEKQHLI